MSIPSSVTSENINKSFSLRVSVLKAYDTLEKFTNGISAVVAPLNVLLAFLVGVGGVIAPLIIRMYNNKRKKKSRSSSNLDGFFRIDK
jgi:hypothetical protein